MRRSVGLGACCALFVVSGCLTPAATAKAPPSAAAQSPAAQSPWRLVDLPLMPEGTRKAVYDAARDSVWVVSLVPPQDAGAAEYVTVTRVDASTHAVTQTGLRLHARQFYQAAVALDANGDLWMAWDRNLVRYDPATGAVDAFALPSFASLMVHVSLYSGEGNFLAVAVDSQGEVWAAADKVAALFGLNPATGTWDRVIHLPWFPYYSTTLATPRPGVLTINGERTPNDKAYYSTFASVDTSSGRVRIIPGSVVDYVVVNEHDVIAMDGSGNLSSVDLDTGRATLLANQAPVCCMTGRPHFATSGDGHVWFGMEGNPVAGLGVLDPTTRSIDFFSFPHPDISPTPAAALCPPVSFDCVPPGTLRGMEIEAVLVDKRQDVWVVNEFPGLNDPDNEAWITPIVELQAPGR